MNYFTGGAQARLNQQQKNLYKVKLHPKSLLKDGISSIRMLPEDKETIFQIVMPWRQEMEEEERKKRKEEKTAEKAGLKQTSLVNFMKYQPKKQVEASIQEEEKKYQEFKYGAEETDDLEGLCKVVKVKEVQKVNLAKLGLGRVQAILINPKWRPQNEFGCFAGEDVEFRLKAEKEGKKDESSDSEEDLKDKDSGFQAFKGISMKEFSQLVFPREIMTDGMLFIWVEKEYIMDVCKFLEGQDFFYVENMCWVMLDPSMKEEVERTKSQDATPAFVRENYQYLKKSKKTLLMFRRLNTDQNSKLELRHQRTGDVVFDWIDQYNPFAKPQYYTYKLIETLLPKAMVEKNAAPLKMVELWA